MSEAEQAPAIPEDLRWLAENVITWPSGALSAVKSEPEGKVSFNFQSKPHYDWEYTRSDWAAARYAVKAEAEPWLDQRMDLIVRNGNDGDHYQEVEQKPQTMADHYPAYYKDVRHLDSVDVYRVHRLFGVTDNEIHHASKKLLLCGVRTGGKPARKEVEEARDTLNRWLEIQAEDERA